MAVYNFSQIDESHHHVGGKAWGLAQLSQKGFQVPQGLVITEILTEEDWQKIKIWWREIQSIPLAVRSSATAEDSKSNSFAGQNQSFLNIKSESELRESILKCFSSHEGEASRSYQRFFAKKNNDNHYLSKGMNVVIQEMVAPRFSGVFFSEDPRSNTVEKIGDDWLLEVVKGLGESLVSGKVTPGKAQANGQSELLPEGFTIEDAKRVASVGQKVALSMGYPTDMEWAIDENNKIYVLQSRPITTEKRGDKHFVELELDRLKRKCTLDTPWDGQTFSEWSGFPSYFTFSIWKNAFSPHNAFGNALKEIGYQSFSDAPYSSKDSLLERVFGRAYVNLDRLSDLYYGPIPYRIELNPRPHATFAFKKINWVVLKHAPSAIVSMLKVAWNLSAKRNVWLEKCSSELNKFKISSSYPLEPRQYQQRSNQELYKTVIKESWRFSKDYLHWPLLLVTLTESTIQRLHILLGGLMDEASVQKTLRDWMGKGLHTTTSAMRAAYQEASQNPSQRAEFLAKFGHRGPGEMDLVNPRWREIDMLAFGNNLKQEKSTLIGHSSSIEVEQEIAKLNTFKREVILEEWRLLKRMLELRELWKMELLKPYAGIRYALNELASRWRLNEDIHWLRLSEIQELEIDHDHSTNDELKEKIINRKRRFDSFRDYYFPNLITLRQIDKIVKGEALPQAKLHYEGEPLSSGLAKGVARVVQDFSKVDFDNWPENAILVAETTDPGWTPLFVKSKGIVIQNGGVLSHCAIVAREMGIPAVSGIRACHRLFKDGDIVWVDGNLGRVSVE